MSNKEVPLSKRMEAIVNMVSIGNRVADVGCDHGFVSIALVNRKISPCAIAMDVNEGPLLHAKENVYLYGVKEKITLRCSDGLKEYLLGEADTLIIAGMGGPLICKILSDSMDKAYNFKEIILSPQSEIAKTRIFLYEHGFKIIDETMVFDDKYYVVMKVVRRAENDDVMLTEMDACFGPILIEKKDKVLAEYLMREREKYDMILCKLGRQGSKEHIDNRIAAVSTKRDLVNETMACMGQA